MRTALIILALLLVGCTPTKQLTTDARTENHTERSASKKRDSIYIYERDSVFVWIRERGDSVIIERYLWRTLYEYRDVIRVDTFVKIDSIFSEKEVVQIVEPSRWQVFWAQLGKVLLAALLLLVVVLVAKKKLLKLFKLWTKR